MSEAPTPLEPAPAGLGRGTNLHLKREDVHELGAFKWRGALPVLTSYRDHGATTVVTASTGNHGAATAWAAQRLGLRDRKSTRLNSSHGYISYAVFCLK